MTEYDPIFAPNDAAVAADVQYDFVACTEAGGLLGTRYRPKLNPKPLTLNP